MKQFLKGFRRYGTVLEGCRESGLDRTTAYRWRKKWVWFAEQWDLAKEDAADKYEEVALDRCKIDNKSNALLQFMLRGMRKEKYSDRQEIKHEGGLTIVVDK